MVHDAAEAALRQVVGRHGIDQVLTEGKLQVQTEIKEKLRARKQQEQIETLLKQLRETIPIWTVYDDE